MSDEQTPATPESDPTGADATSDPVGTPAASRDWIVPVVGLGSVLLAVIVFFGGFAVGRATADDDSWDWDDRVEARMELHGMSPRGLDEFFRDFGRRGPQGRSAPDMRRFEDFESIPEAALERFCELLEAEAIPPNLPFVDRLTELCEAEGT